LRQSGEVAHVVAGSAAEAGPMLKALLAQKLAQARAGGPPDAYASAHAQAFLRRLCESGLLELQALTLNGRVIAAFGALRGDATLCGLILSRESDPEIARHAPGRLLLHAVVASAIARGLTRFDLGVGEARYKSEFCEIAEPLFDAFIPASPLGRAATAAFRLARAAKGRIKRSPRLLAIAEAIRRRRP
jgi:CelD/BcsL family acetyltransferase involved in cellulose biosynthesis